MMKTLKLAGYMLTALFGFADIAKENPQEPLKNGAQEAISTAERVDREIFFETKVRPVLTQKCLKCHQKNPRNGNYSVDGRLEILGPSLKSPVIQPGDSSKSRLTATILIPGKPNSSNHHEIPQLMILDLNRWINDGAIWPHEHSELNPQ